jgi:hypothetical protein
MKIKIEIDLKPEELQRFLGLPDVGAMREEVMQFVKERIAADPAGFVLENLDQLRKSRTVRRILFGRDEAGPERASRSGKHEPHARDRQDDES